MDQADRSRKCREWTNRLSRFEKSGLSVAEFCRREQVSVATFYYWKRRLHGTSSHSERPKAAVSRTYPTQPASTANLPGKSGSSPADEPAFRPVQVSFAPKPAVLVVRLPGDVELRVEDEPQLAEKLASQILQLTLAPQEAR
ncbi:MAG: hypothetical protein KatS3mg109_1964 [Pirellulaceae bacterium]|nr:MAG: hypothetical protein KatS3mg109_1964 [Pirellulaceae bacterium]